MTRSSKTLVTGIALLAAAGIAVQGSSHREAPGITGKPKLDGTDFYMFRSYEPGRQGYVTLIANYIPLQDAYGGPNFFTMDLMSLALMFRCMAVRTRTESVARRPVLVFVAQKPGGALQLYMRRLDQLEAVPLPGTDGANSPFFSPDGQWVAFNAGGKLKKVSVTGGAAVEVGDTPVPAAGGAWSEDGATITFSPHRSAGLVRVSSDGGGKPEPVNDTRRRSGHTPVAPDAARR